MGSWLEETVSHWKENGIQFDLIYTGYLGSVEAVRIASDVIKSMLAPGGVVVVDPALADHGKCYSGLSEAYCREMFELCARADIMIPNITEAAMMAGLPYQSDPDEQYVEELLRKIPGKAVLLTGVGFSPDQTGFALRTETGVSYHFHSKVGKSYSGTGDIFASAFCGAVMTGKALMDAAKIAAQFTLRCIEETTAAPAHWYGVKFEAALPELIKLL